MCADKNLTDLLKWSIENSTSSDPNGDPQVASPQKTTTLNAEALAELMGAPSEAELMKAAMSAITSSDPEMTLASKLVAFDNLEQLIESLDNANLLSRLGLWTPLLECLGHEEAEIRRMAAWCVGTAVQNNEPCQERLVALGGVERLVGMTLGARLEMEKRAGDGDVTTTEGIPPGETETKEVRRKAVYALSSAIRNYQPALDVAIAELRRKGESVAEKVDATDMDAVDEIIQGLRNRALNA